MPITTFEGTVENGRIRLRDDVKLPENATGYVIVPGGWQEQDSTPARLPRVHSPKLVDRDRVAEFEKHITEVPADAGI